MNNGKRNWTRPCWVWGWVWGFAFLLGTSVAPIASFPQEKPAPEKGPSTNSVELRLKLMRQLEQVAASFDGVLGLAAKDLTSGEMLRINAGLTFPQASSIKMAILIELFRQVQECKVSLSERVEIRHAQTTGGSGILNHFAEGGSAISLGDLAVLMIQLSDNSATNIIIGRVGMANINATLSRLGFERTKLQRVMMDQEAQRNDHENLSTPAEMALLLERLVQGKILDAEHTAAALEILKYEKDTPLRAGLPAGAALADKPGSMPGVRCDSGIVFLGKRAYVIAVMTTFAKDERAAEHAITEVSRRVYDYFERVSRSNSFGSHLQ
jgi:beta-lactamase class A